MNHSTSTATSNDLAARGEKTRRALVAAGRKVFAQRGFDGASVRHITREAGANLGAVTYHFGSKRALYAHVVTAAFNPLVERVEQVAREEGAAGERLGRVIDVIFDFLGANPDLPRLLLQEIAAGRRPPPELVTLIQRNLRNISAVLTDGVREGSMRPGHPVLSTLSVISQPIYMSVMAPMLREAGGLDLADPAARAMAARHVTDFVLAGLAGPEESPT